ncbi:MAG: LLM class flavin-dependent oxidoreductase [Actinomycetota bacterium]
MSSVKLGVTLPQFSDDPARLTDAVQAIEGMDLDSVWVFDHLWPLSGGKERPIFEAWTTLAWLASITERVSVGTLVSRSSLRHPALLAKMAATVASIAPDRVIVGIGSGDDLSRDENEAFGIQYFESDDRIDQLRSVVEAVVNHLRLDKVTLEDDFVHLNGLPTSPMPAIPPPVWVGGRSDDTLEIAATLADGWNGWGGTASRFAEDAGTVVEMAGERPLELSWGGQLVLRQTQGAAEEALGKHDPDQHVTGDPESVGARLNGYIDAGATHLILTPAGRWDLDTVELLAAEVRPLLHPPKRSDFRS